MSLSQLEKYVDDQLTAAKELSDGKMSVSCVFFNQKTLDIAKRMTKGRKGFKLVKLKLSEDRVPIGVSIPRGGLPHMNSAGAPGGRTLEDKLKALV